MKFLREIFENLDKLSQQSKLLKLFKPVINATDEFFFGTAQVAASPHIVDHIDIKRFMSFVVIGLLPAAIAAVYLWGLRVLLVIAVSYIFGGLVEVAFAVVRKKEIHEGFLVTGLIFPLILPPTVPLWMVAVGVMFGVIFGKEAFGGTGRNVFNAAIVGRIFLSVAFPQAMTVSWSQPFHQGLGGFLKFSADATTQATPLALFKNEKLITNFWDLFLGNSLGCIGETFRIGIILGGLFLILAKVSNWRLPLSAILSVLFFSFLGNLFAAQKFAPPLFQILNGGLLLGVFFMLTDPVTCPFTKAGKWLGGILFGFLVVLIRGLSGYTEGVMFSILLLNVFAPLIDHLVLDAKYPELKK
jgi:RnfABCDGE-type electron transport complex D subunit